jgi:tRNA (guanine-N7-)-methyltransferase
VRLRVRHHVNPLKAELARYAGGPVAVAAGRAVELEIGCADAQFLFERAAGSPDRSYVGVEIRQPLVEDVNRRAALAGAPVQAVLCHANLHLRALLPAASVQRAYVNFPDPWFKRRHHKRRVVDDGLVRDLCWLLEPGGELFVQSDVWAVALDAMAVLERHDSALENVAGAWSFWKRGNPYGARSAREQHCEEAALAVWRIRYRRRAGAR